MSKQYFTKWNMSKLSEKHESCSIFLSNTISHNWTLKELQNNIGFDFNQLSELLLSYSPLYGSDSLRQEIINFSDYDFNIEGVATSVGAVEAIFCFLQSTIKRGDKVICVSPAYEALWRIPQIMGADLEFFTLKISHDYCFLDIEGLVKNINDKTKLLIVNFPNNPTGFNLNISEWEFLIKALRKHDCILLSDEVFSGLKWNRSYKDYSAAKMYEKAFSIGSASKALSLPGLRVGWIASQQQQTIKKIVSIKRYFSKCNDKLSEEIVRYALKNSQYIFEKNISIIKRNWDILKIIANKYHDYLKVVEPMFGPLATVHIDNNLSLDKFIEKLTKDHGVSILPLSLMAYEGNFFRIGLGGENFDYKIKEFEKGLLSFLR